MSLWRPEAGAGTRGAVHSKRGPAMTNAMHHMACAAADSTRRPTCTLRVDIFTTKRGGPRRRTNAHGAHGAADSKRWPNLRVLGVAWFSVCGGWCVLVRSSAIAHASADHARASRRMSRVCSTGRWALGYSQDGGGQSSLAWAYVCPFQGCGIPPMGGVLARPLVTGNPTQNVHI